MVSEDLGTAIENFVEVFRCEPKEQAKSQLRQLIEEQPVKYLTHSPSAVIEDYENQINALIKGNEQLKAKAEDAEAQNEALKKWNEKLKKTVQKEEKAPSGEFEWMLKEVREENRRLLERVENAERALQEEKTLRQAHDETLDLTVERLGGKVEGKKTAKHNFLQRIDELIEKEKAHFKPKSNKKK